MIPSRLGSPNEMFEAPQVVFTPSSSRSRRTRWNTWRPAEPIAPMGITRGSTTTSSLGIPWSAARCTIFRATSKRTSGSSLMPVSSFVIATTAALSKAQAWRLAVQGHAGLSRAITPSHTLYDGDTVFVLATGRDGVGARQSQELIQIGEAAAQSTAEAVRRAVRAARGLGEIPGRAELSRR